MTLPENWMRQYSLSAKMRNGGCWTSGGCPLSTDRNGVEKDYMTLQMNYQEKYEQGVEQEKRQSAFRMIEAGKLSSEEIALYSGLELEQVLELEKELQPV